MSANDSQDKGESKTRDPVDVYDEICKRPCAPGDEGDRHDYAIREVARQAVLSAIVAREPTREMLDAGVETPGMKQVNAWNRAIKNAAPQPPAAPCPSSPARSGSSDSANGEREAAASVSRQPCEKDSGGTAAGAAPDNRFQDKQDISRFERWWTEYWGYEGRQEDVSESAEAAWNAAISSASGITIDPEALKLAEYWKNWQMSDGVGTLARELLRIAAALSATGQQEVKP